MRRRSREDFAQVPQIEIRRHESLTQRLKQYQTELAVFDFLVMTHEFEVTVLTQRRRF